MKYFVDEEEQIGWEKEYKISMENPIVEEVPHEHMQEGYIVDEEMSTILPFQVTEENNVIEVYYIIDNGIQLFAIGGLQSNYNATTDVFRLETVAQSTNTHTRVFYAWYDGPNLYFVIGTHNGGKVTNIYYNGSLTNSAVDIHSGTTSNQYINVNGQPYYLYDNSYPTNPAKIWNVVNLGPQTLSSTFTIGVTTDLGKGHHVDFTMRIASALQVYHDYGDGEILFDTDQSGYLNSDFSYNVHPIYTHNGEEYELINIQVYHNGTALPDKGPGDLVAGNLTGIVGGTLTNRSAKIIFIYKKVEKGRITITKTVENYDSNKDGNKKFDIFINGPNGKEWTVRLEHGESKTIENLQMGEYTITEIVPMNYELISISSSNITLTSDATEASTTVINKRNNDGWFYDDDERENKFGVGIVQTPRNMMDEQNQMEYDFDPEFIQDMILPPENGMEEILLEEGVPLEDEV